MDAAWPAVCDGDQGLLQGLVEDGAASPWAGNAARDRLIDYLEQLGDAEAARLRASGAERADSEILDIVISVVPARDSAAGRSASAGA